MSPTFAFVLIATLNGLLVPNGVQAKRFFGVGQRIEDDQLLLKDVQHSRPGGTDEPASVSFNYNIAEPITYIEIVSEENISAEVKLSYTDTYVVGVVRLVPSNASQDDDEASTDSPNAFDVTIRIFGFNESVAGLNAALLLNRDFEGEVRPYDDIEKDWEQVALADEKVTHEYDELTTDTPNPGGDFEIKDKVIEIGQRQRGDDLLYETYQTSSDDSKTPVNHTLIFYYIDSSFITYIKFVLFDHFAEKGINFDNYTAPVAEYSHYGMGTFKATITDYGVKSLFVQMFVYGYQGVDVPPSHYIPFLKPEQSRTVALTPAQRLQLMLLTGRATTPTPLDSDEDEDYVMPSIRPEDMIPDHAPILNREETPDVEPAPTMRNSVQKRALSERLYAMMGLMLYAVV